MEVVYFFNKKLKYSPVKKYLSVNFNPENKGDSRKITDIKSKIEYIKDRNGQPDGSIAKQIHGFGVIEMMMRKNADRLLRIMYFCCEDRLVLLRAFDKPKNYESEKIKKEIKEEYRLSEEAKSEYIKDKTSYEDYGE
jgi:hypothetical protein